MRRTGDVWLALALSALATVACSDPHGGTLPTISPSVTATPSTTPSATKTTDPATSLKAALQNYFDALYAAGLDPEHKTDALARLITPSCTCRQVIDALREEARQHRYIDYRYTLHSIQVVDVGPVGGDVQYTVTRSAGAERDASDRIIESFAATTDRYGAHFRNVDGRWLLDSLTRFK